jgi:hypothetical protein
VNTIQNRVEADRELLKATKMVKTYEMLTADINAEIAKLHLIGLKSAIRELEQAKERVARAKKLVRLRIKILRLKPKKG